MRNKIERQETNQRPLDWDSTMDLVRREILQVRCSKETRLVVTLCCQFEENGGE
ncbi:MAG: hypothetical protein VXW02_03505 [Verrucomicrobiota bacterium]|nr:hypothetical protein [Verrucomicrobiota bacterium]